MRKIEEIKQQILSLYKNIDDKELIINKSMIVTFLMMMISFIKDDVILNIFITLSSICCLGLNYLQYLVEYERLGYSDKNHVYVWSIISFLWVMTLMLSV